MVLDLTGILETGVPRQAGITENPRRTLRIPLGADVTLRLRVLTPDGALLSLVGATLVWSVKRRPSDGQVIISKTGVAGVGADAGSTVFTLIPFDTRLISPGLYGYDIWLTQGGKRDPVVPLSPLQFEATVTPIP